MSTTDPEKLNPTQLGALLIFMAEAREISNTELEELASFRLAGPDRKTLEDRGLIECRKLGQTYAFQLTDKGWRYCKRLHRINVNVGNSRAARAIFTLLGGLDRALDRLNVSHAEFFKQSGDMAAEPVPVTDIERRIRDAYHKLSGGPGEWVGLADLRNELTGLDRTAVDETLRAMVGAPEVRIIPIANTKSLEPRDHTAAVRIGPTDNHVIAISQP